MKSRESRYPDDWFRVGEREHARAKLLLENGDLSGAGFNLHQAAERYLKGYLLSRGWKLRRIHDLETLLNEAAEHDAGFRSLASACLKINQYYLEERYPFTAASDLTPSEIRQSFEAVEGLIARIQKTRD